MCHDISRSCAVNGLTEEVELTLHQAVSCVSQQYITARGVRLIQPDTGPELHAYTAGSYFADEGILAITLISKSKPASQLTPIAVQFG